MGNRNPHRPHVFPGGDGLAVEAAFFHDAADGPAESLFRLLGQDFSFFRLRDTGHLLESFIGGDVENIHNSRTTGRNASGGRACVVEKGDPTNERPIDSGRVP